MQTVKERLFDIFSEAGVEDTFHDILVEQQERADTPDDAANYDIIIANVEFIIGEAREHRL